ncbi:hypothetical protein SAMN06265339_0997 [Desulfurobacterium pacificum]|uniref:Lipoprotein n=1 Tax=Desulfurobacterium pacificum TaxID=240166 RepID=A0ABY1NK93_9BACT|nr:hypothetical protein [Desulfurobacterium pacificum]SMP11880.1 hypothetical protein SAMN06265339_0997 [Desulfurobacterium pacificum]
MRFNRLFSALVLGVFVSGCGGISGNVSQNSSTSQLTGVIYDAFIKGLYVCPSGVDPSSSQCNVTDGTGKYSVKGSEMKLDLYLPVGNNFIYLGSIPADKSSGNVVRPTDLYFDGELNKTMGLDLGLYLETLAAYCTNSSTYLSWDLSGIDAERCSGFVGFDDFAKLEQEKGGNKVVYCLSQSYGNGTAFKECLDNATVSVNDSMVDDFRSFKEKQLYESNPELIMQQLSAFSIFYSPHTFKGKLRGQDFEITLTPTEVNGLEVEGNYSDSFENGTYKLFYPLDDSTGVAYAYPVLLLNNKYFILMNEISPKGFLGVYADVGAYSFSYINVSLDGIEIPYNGSNATDMVKLMNEGTSYYFSSYQTNSWYQTVLPFNGTGTFNSMTITMYNNNWSINLSNAAGDIQVENGKVIFSSGENSATVYSPQNTRASLSNWNFTFTLTPMFAYQVDCSDKLAADGFCKEGDVLPFLVVCRGIFNFDSVWFIPPDEQYYLNNSIYEGSLMSTSVFIPFDYFQEPQKISEPMAFKKES